MSIVQKAADAVLASDRNKSAEWGGQKLTHIARVDVEGNGDDSPITINVIGKDGRTAMAIPNHARCAQCDRPARPGGAYCLRCLLRHNESARASRKRGAA